MTEVEKIDNLNEYFFMRQVQMLGETQLAELSAKILSLYHTVESELKIKLDESKDD